MDGRHLHNRRKCLIIVDAVCLRVAIGHQLGLILVEEVVGVVLYLVHPFVADRLDSLGSTRSEVSFLASACVSSSMDVF